MGRIFLVLFFFSFQLTFAETKNYPDQVNRLILAGDRTIGFYKAYRDYIGKNGFFNDQTYVYLEQKLVSNRKFTESATNGGEFRDLQEYFQAFHDVTKAFSVHTFRSSLGKKEPKTYIEELDKMRAEYDRSITDRRNTPDVVRDMKRKRDGIILLKQRILDYQKARQSVSESALKAVKNRQDELANLYDRISSDK